MKSRSVEERKERKLENSKDFSYYASGTRCMERLGLMRVPEMKTMEAEGWTAADWHEQQRRTEHRH